ncbi:MAG TPA: ABC transporter ATP-binding protein [Candidatus Thermoplasmatota archaeon]|nr:ABC transporter ATP-binding protein [Candidatus Thermoplasmatota archaeon]
MTTPTLETRGLTRRFGELVAVDALSIRVHPGEIYGFLGPNGAGKTTSIRMMAGLLRPTAGSVHVLGQEVAPSAPDARRLVGLCPQENVVYPELTARENLEYAAALYDVPRAKRRERALTVLRELGLEEKAEARASALSGGMKRRLTMGLAIVHEPPVVVLDEPEAGLDPQTRVQVRSFIQTLRERHTVVLTSHNMDEVERLADRVAIVDQGRLVAEGTPHELKAKLGSGDLLEVTLADERAESVVAALRPHVAGDVAASGRVVSVRGLDLARQFPTLLATVQDAGAAVVDVRYRGNTLEDVFIALTGRGLRE